MYLWQPWKLEDAFEILKDCGFQCRDPNQPNSQSSVRAEYRPNKRALEDVTSSNQATEDKGEDLTQEGDVTAGKVGYHKSYPPSKPTSVKAEHTQVMFGGAGLRNNSHTFSNMEENTPRKESRKCSPRMGMAFGEGWSKDCCY